MEQLQLAAPDRHNPDVGKPPAELALEQQIREHAAAGREPERSRAAWALAEAIMRRTLP